MRSTKLGRFLLVSLLLLVAAGALAWWFRDDLRRWAGPREDAVAISPEVAAEAEAKIERLRSAGEPARLSGAEISSLIRYRLSGWVPASLQDPSVSFAGDTVWLRGRLPTDELPSLPELDRVRGLLPDTTPVELAGHLTPLDNGRAAFEIQQVEVSGVPIPSRFYAPTLQRLGRRDEPGLPPEAVSFGLPEGVGSARVEANHLVLTR